MTINAFGAQLLTLPQIFENRLFTIPDFQRSYAWDDDQVKDLLKDIDYLMDDGTLRRHYTGTLVLSSADGPDGSEFLVVDGQQRLTTLVTVLRLLADHLPDGDRSAFDALYLRRGDLGADRAVLRLNSDTRLFFERVVIADGEIASEAPTLEAHARLFGARSVIQSWMGARIDAGTSVQQLRATLENELGFLVYAPAEDAETGIMFEVINNRGKKLSELEKVKNYLIYCCVKLSAPSLRADIEQDWSQILRHLNVARKTQASDEGAFLRYCLVVYFKLNKADNQSGYDELKKRFALESAGKDVDRRNAIIADMKAFVLFMKSAALWFARLYGQQHQGLDRPLIDLLEQSRGQDRQASIMPLFLALVIKHDGHGQPMLRLLEIVEKLNFRVYMARNIMRRNDSKQADLYAFAADYYHGELLEVVLLDKSLPPRVEITDEDHALEYRLVEFIVSFALDAKLEQSLRLEPGSNDNFYSWGGLRYFLMSYEQHLQPKKTIQIDKISMARSEGKPADYLSVEHRWALEYRNGAGENDRDVDDFERRRLGNFVLLELRLNIQGSDGSLEDKNTKYIDGKGEEPPTDLQQVRKMFKETRQALKDLEGLNRSKNYHLKLNRQINDRVEELLSAFALKRWSLKDYLGYKQLKVRAESGAGEDGA